MSDTESGITDISSIGELDIETTSLPKIHVFHDPNSDIETSYIAILEYYEKMENLIANKIRRLISDILSEVEISARQSKKFDEIVRTLDGALGDFLIGLFKQVTSVVGKLTHINHQYKEYGNVQSQYNQYSSISQRDTEDDLILKDLGDKMEKIVQYINEKITEYNKLVMRCLLTTTAFVRGIIKNPKLKESWSGRPARSARSARSGGTVFYYKLIDDLLSSSSDITDETRNAMREKFDEMKREEIPQSNIYLKYFDPPRARN